MHDIPAYAPYAAAHLAATHIEDLGGVESAVNERERFYYQERFRRQFLHDAPARVDHISTPRGVSARQIGEIVHEVLRHEHLPENDKALRDLLESYAWRHHITAERAVEEAVQQAQRLVTAFRRSASYQWIQQAAAVYRELPFVYQEQSGGEPIIHGVMDVLLRMPDERWVIIDYKTSAVANAEAAKQHARRYHLQLAVYARAVAQQLDGIQPETYVHYIRGGYIVPIPAAARQTALARGLSARIADITKDKL
jgi:ATP-dependent exoDNAse (exonuclease V) beta subunit